MRILEWLGSLTGNIYLHRAFGISTDKKTISQISQVAKSQPVLDKFASSVHGRRP